ncbi:MAG: (Fe-S)-binding protein [Calditrichaeota bacterium]|nr:(Fe-S)-binding protein [Calditrichota bacterium]
MAQTVHLFIPCFVNAFFPTVGIACVEILENLGYRVVYSTDQTCCGQPAYNSGYVKEARSLATRAIQLFGVADYIVAPSGSCTAMLKHYYGTLPLTRKERQDWDLCRNRFYEITQFITRVAGVNHWKGTFPHSVTFHDACHALRELGIRDEPRQLLTRIQRLKLIEMPHADRCCGFGGTFSVKFPELSTAILEAKIASLKQTGAEFVVSTDSSCLMHIAGYLKKHGESITALHLVEVLWQAWKNDGSPPILNGTHAP